MFMLRPNGRQYGKAGEGAQFEVEKQFDDRWVITGNTTSKVGRGEVRRTIYSWHLSAEEAATALNALKSSAEASI